MRRLNLLPLNRRLGLRREVMLSSVVKFLRGVVIGLGVFIVVGVLVGFGLWVMGETMARSTDADLQIEVDKYKRLRTVIARDNAMLNLVNGLVEDRVEWSLIIADLLKIVPPDVVIESIQAEAGESLISFSGSALNRSSLVVFEDRLRVLPWVKEVVAPRENLLKRVKPSYNIRIIVDTTKVDLTQE